MEQLARGVVAMMLTGVGLAAQAQGSVQLNGLIDVFAGQRQLAGRGRLHSLDSGGMSTSRFGLDGGEDLGGGFKAQFALSAFLRADSGEAGRFTNDTMWRRGAWLGLASPYGTLRLGRVGTRSFGHAARFNAFGDSTSFAPFMLHTFTGGQPLMAPLSLPDSSADNALDYQSPAWGGLNAYALYAPSEDAAARGRKRWILAATWAQGPLAMGLVQEQLNVRSLLPPGVLQTRHRQAGVSYDLGACTLYGQFGQTAQQLAGGERRLETLSLGAALPVGSGKWLLSFARTRKTETALARVRRATLALGYDYALSKRSDLYLVALRDSVSGLANGRSLVAGLRHRF